MSIVLLWTDYCLLFVTLLSVFFVFFGCRRPPVRRAFQRIISQPIPAGAGVLLLFFLAIGVLDSIQVQHMGKLDTLLDLSLSPLNAQYEKTYSAPLALNSYTTEMLNEGGVMKQVYPRLVYPSAHIKTEEDKQAFIHASLARAFFVSMLVLLGYFVLRMLWRKWFGKSLFWRPDKASVVAIIVFLLSLFALLACYFISRELHVLGTGKIGQDIFYYALKSIRTGLVIGILTTLFMMPLALAFGVSAGYFGGLVDDVIQYVYTTLSSIPSVLLISASVLSMQTYMSNHPEQFTSLELGADARLLALCLILGVTSWTSLCRLLRAEALKLREIDFVIAAKAMGTSHFKILYKHLLPNLMHIVVITLVLDFSFLVLAEAVLAYVGVGVAPVTISWGNMINAARLELAREPVVWWPMLAAFGFMFTLVLASNLFADAVRDAFDPDMRSELSLSWIGYAFC